jgi:hypothetical protein
MRTAQSMVPNVLILAMRRQNSTRYQAHARIFLTRPQ